MRLFIAVDVDAASRRAAQQLRDRVRQSFGAEERALRWVDPKNLHLTLRFLGDCQDVTPLERALETPLERTAFELRWANLAWLPPHGRPRVLYVPVGDGAAELQALWQEVSARLTTVGVTAEERPFTAHLTLARVRDVTAPGAVRTLVAALSQRPFTTGWPVRVEAAVLYESQLSPRGPTYAPRLRMSLK